MGNLRKFKFRYKPFIPFHERNQITHFKLLLKYEKEDKENYHLYQNPIEQELVLIRFILLFYQALLKENFQQARACVQYAEESLNPLILLSINYVNEYILKKIDIDYLALKDEDKLYVLVNNPSYRTKFLKQPDNFPNLGIPEPLIKHIYHDELDPIVQSYLDNPQKCHPDILELLKNKFQLFIKPPIKFL